MTTTLQLSQAPTLCLPKATNDFVRNLSAGQLRELEKHHIIIIVLIPNCYFTRARSQRHTDCLLQCVQVQLQQMCLSLIPHRSCSICACSIRACRAYRLIIMISHQQLNILTYGVCLLFSVCY